MFQLRETVRWIPATSNLVTRNRHLYTLLAQVHTIMDNYGRQRHTTLAAPSDALTFELRIPAIGPYQCTLLAQVMQQTFHEPPKTR